MQTLNTKSQARWRRPGFLRAVLLAPLVFLVSLGLTFTATQTGARAYAVPPAPVVIAGAVRGAPMLLAATANPATLVPAAIALLGIAAYETRDSWVPVVADFFNGSTDSSTSAPTDVGLMTCATFTVTPSASNTVHLVANGECGVQTNYFQASGVVCKTSTGYNAGSSGTLTEFRLSQTYAGTTTWSGNVAVCPVNSVVMGGKFSLYETYGSWASRTEWLTLGSPGYPAEDQTTTTTVQCRKPDGTTVTIADTETGHPERIAVPSCADRVPGSVPWSVSVKGGPSVSLQRDYVTTTTDQALWDSWSDCFDATGLTCALQVWIGVDPATAEPCTIGAPNCNYWREYAKTFPSRVQCRFGTHVLPLSDCNVLRHAYRKPVTVTQVVPGTKTEPQLDPDAATGGAPGTSGPPTTGTNPDAPATDTESNPDTTSCLGQAWSWNPVDWVYVPVKCAFLWGFKPSEGLTPRVDRLREKYKGRVPFAFVGPILLMGTSVGQNCPDWRVNISPTDGALGNLDQNIVCDSSFTAAIRNARPFLTGGMILLAFWPFVRGMIYASTPILKPTPTDGK